VTPIRNADLDRNTDRGRYAEYATWYRALFVILAGAIIFGSASLIYPFGRDQAEYGYTAAAALAGKVVYRDVFCVKPPMTHLVHMLALVLFGHSMFSIRVLDLLWQAATAVVIWRIVRRLQGAGGTRGSGAGAASGGGSTSLGSAAALNLGVLAALLYLLAYFAGDFWSTAQTEGFQTLPVALAVLAVLGGGSGRPRGRWILLGGAALGCAALFKYPIALLVFPAVLLPLRPSADGARRPPAPVDQRGAPVRLLFVAGLVIPVLLTISLLVVQGALGPFLSIGFKYYPAYNFTVSGGGFYAGSVLGGVFHHLLYNHILQLMILMVLIDLIISLRRRELRVTFIIHSWWAVAFVQLVLQNKYYPYHYLPLLAPSAVVMARLAGRLGSVLGATLPGRWPMRWGFNVMVAALFLAAWFGAGFADLQRTGLKVLTGKSSLDGVYRTFAQGDYSVAADLDVARYLAGHTAPSATLFVWGFEPAVYFLARRTCASRFPYDFPLYGNFPWPELRNELMGELTAHPPAYFVVVRNDAMPAVTGSQDDSYAALTRFGTLREFLAGGYEFDTSIEDFGVFRRRGP
jgi:4-amino-4-deoxy-L-arabinose transferase-like glycosyltransferase